MRTESKTVRFNLNLPEEAAAYDAVKNAGNGNGNRFIIGAINYYMDHKSDKEESSKLLDMIRQVIQEELSKMKLPVREDVATPEKDGLEDLPPLL
jgi:hypothetical protein